MLWQKTLFVKLRQRKEFQPAAENSGDQFLNHDLGPGFQFIQLTYHGRQTFQAAEMCIRDSPIMASSFLGTAYNITDMAWIGLLGSKAVAGVGVGGMYVWLSQGPVSYTHLVTSCLPGHT